MIPEVNYAGFSCPQAGLDRALLELIVTDHARQVVQKFVERHQPDFEAQMPALYNLLRQWSSRDGSSQDDVFDTIWNFAFGDIHASLLSNADDVVRCAAALGLRLNQYGHAAEWEARLSRPTRLRIGKWLLPSTDAIRVCATPESVVVEARVTSGWRTMEFRRSPNDWHGADPEALTVVDHAGLRFAVVTAHALSPSSAMRLLKADAYDFDPTEVSGVAEWRSTCETAASLIAEAAPLYTPWVSTVLRDLVPLRARPGIFNSGSERFSPGVICISNQRYPWPLAEMLIHEATHQYLNIITRLGSLDDGTDQRLYFSPFRNKERPIFFIVAAYHAFANVLLFYRTARAHGFLPERLPESGAFTNREENLELQLKAIEPALRGTASLTTLGRALWEPLYEQVHLE